MLRSAFCLPLFLQCWDAPCSCLFRLSTHPTTMLSSSTPPTSTRRWSRVTVCGWLSSTLPGKSPFWPLFSDLQWLHYSHRFSDGEPVTLQSVVNMDPDETFSLDWYFSVKHTFVHIRMYFLSLTLEWIEDVVCSIMLNLWDFCLKLQDSAWSLFWFVLHGLLLQVWPLSKLGSRLEKGSNSPQGKH